MKHIGIRVKIALAALLSLGTGLRAAEAAKPAPTNAPVRVTKAGLKASWSPDGMQLVYNTPDNRSLEIYEFKTLTNRSQNIAGRDVAWSPDGKWIAYVKVPETGAAFFEEIWRIAPEGGRPKLVYPGAWPVWSGDSQKVYVFSRQERKLLACDLAKPDDPAAVLSENPLGMYPMVSPDGKMIAYLPAEKAVIVDAKTGESLFSIPMQGERGGFAGWSPDSKRLAIGGFDNSPLGVWLVDLEAKKVHPLAAASFTMPVWSPKGDRLAMDLRKGRLREIWVFERSWIDARLKNETPVFTAPEE